MFQLRPASVDHGPAIVKIMNQAIESGQNGYVEPLKGIDSEKWLNSLFDKSITLVSVVMDSNVVGWGALLEYRIGRPAFRQVFEICFYVDKQHHRKGIGSALIDYLEGDARKNRTQNLIAILLGDNESSIAILQRHGYLEWGRMPSIAHVGDTDIDHLYFGKTLQDLSKVDEINKPF